MLTINKIFPQEKIPEKTESFLFFIHKNLVVKISLCEENVAGSGKSS